jgi:predicted nucleotidyltransferase
MNLISNINKNIFKKHRVEIAYLFGSRTKNKSVKASDFDIAILFKNSPSESLAIKKNSFLSMELNRFFPGKIDMVSLNHASSLLRYEVVAHGQVLYCANKKDRVNFEVSVIKEYIDGEPLRKLYNNALHKQILRSA